MDWVIVAGVVSLGAILGWMGYVVFVGQSNIKTFTAIGCIFGGAVIAGIFQAIAGTKAALPREVWFYPVGLLAGVGVTAAFAGYHRRRDQAIAADERRQEQALVAAERRQEQELADAESKRERAKNLIVTTIKERMSGGRHITMMSFDELRRVTRRSDLTDEFCNEIIEYYPKELCYRTLAEDRPGIG